MHKKERLVSEREKIINFQNCRFLKEVISSVIYERLCTIWFGKFINRINVYFHFMQPWFCDTKFHFILYGI